MSLFCVSGCGVTPCAWVNFKIDGGFVYHSSDMYGYNQAHIYYFENQEASSDTSNYLISISFIPRSLGFEIIEKDGEKIKTTLVDITRYVDMQVYVKVDSSVYSAEKNFYINGQKLEPTSSNISSSLASFTYQDIQLDRGNPDGKINGVVNYIEYK